MRVTIVGTGTVGANLGRGLAACDHDVTFGVRDPDDPAVTKLCDETGARARPVIDAIEANAVVVLALPGDAVASFATRHRDALAGKTVVDPTNTFETPRSAQSRGEAVASAVPDANVVKAFNTVGAEHFSDPRVTGERASMLVCGDNARAKAKVRALASDLGFDPVDAGGIDAAGDLEALARLWVRLAQRHGRDIAFRLLGT